VRHRLPLSYQASAAYLCPRFVQYQGPQCHLFPENNPTPAFLSNEVRKKQTRKRAELMVNGIRKIGHAIFAAIFFFLEFSKSFPADKTARSAGNRFSGMPILLSLHPKLILELAFVSPIGQKESSFMIGVTILILLKTYAKIPGIIIIVCPSPIFTSIL
jgi:hypothetical protein